MNVERVALVTALFLVAGCLVVVLLRVLARVLKDRAEQRGEHVRSSVWLFQAVRGQTHRWGDMQRAGFEQS